MSFSNATEIDLLAKIFNATALPWDGISNLYLSLHTGDPLESGTQLSNEATYGGYARKVVARTSGGWTVSSPAGASQVTNAALVQFDLCSSLSDIVTHVAIGTASSGAGQILVSGALNSPRTISAGIQPQFNASDLIFTLD